MPSSVAPRNIHRKKSVSKSTAGWRGAPATDRQLKVLRKIAMETGITFETTITAGQASDLIAARLAANPKAARAHVKAERKRRQLDQRLVNPAAHWRFGDKQTPEQELAEIRRARRDGLEPVYVELQTWVMARRQEASPATASDRRERIAT